MPPTFARRPEPIYPPDLLLSGVEGSVQLLVHVGSNGKPLSVNIHRSSGYRQMDQSALGRRGDLGVFARPQRSDPHCPERHCACELSNRV